MITITKQQLKEQDEIHFDNSNCPIAVANDDVRSGFVFKHHMIDTFCIMFNGQLIASYKTLNFLNKRLNNLFEEWNLEIKVLD